MFKISEVVLLVMVVGGGYGKCSIASLPKLQRETREHINDYKSTKNNLGVIQLLRVTRKQDGS